MASYSAVRNRFSKLLQYCFVLVETVFGVCERSPVRDVHLLEVTRSHESVLSATNDLSDLHRMLAFAVELTHYLDVKEMAAWQQLLFTAFRTLQSRQFLLKI